MRKHQVMAGSGITKAPDDVQFINSVERALFGEFNNGQIKDFPVVRLKRSTWLEYIYFKPVISKEQMYQAATLASSDTNPIDECSQLIVELVGIQDCSNVTLILEGLSTIHYDKVQYGQIRADFLIKNVFLTPEEAERALLNDEAVIYSENEKNFLSIYSQCLKPQSLEQPEKTLIKNSKNTLLELPQHLLMSLYMVKYLRAREARVKLLYTLNMFRAVQKRLTLELREMGTRDRVMADCFYLSPQENLSASDSQIGSQDEKASTGRKNPGSETNDGPGFHDSTYSQLYKLDVTGSPQKQGNMQSSH